MEQPVEIFNLNTDRLMVKRYSISKWIINLFFVGFCAFCILPFVIIIASSFSKESDILAYGYSFFPRHATAIAYEVILRNPVQLINGYIVTITVTVLGTIISLWLTTSLAYVIVRKTFKYRRLLAFMVFFTMLFKGGLVPSYILVSNWLHMKDTIFALFIPSLLSAWNVLLMKTFLQNVPDSLYECAKLDGAGELRIFVNIVIPLSKPAIATVGVFLVLQFWNDWFNCLLYIENQRLFTLQFLLLRIVNQIEFLTKYFSTMPAFASTMDLPSTTARFAMCILAAGPMLFIFMAFQKYFVKGLTVGSIKG